ncbi:hypothetical protein TNCV_3071221 [Trichonephila clavipes]|nr:hypothetical protein TNCV_3071221 [Trichonephila clavipes]
MVAVDTRLRVTRLIVDNDELGAGTADFDNQSFPPICCSHSLTATIMKQNSSIVHPFLPASSNGRIASTHMTSDSPICPTCLFQLNDTTLSNSDSCS